MSRLTRREKTYLREIHLAGESLRNDPARRLRNALRALAAMDPAWMIWVSDNVPRGCDLQDAMRLVETRARELVTRGYKFLGEGVIKMIVHSGRPFADDGSLMI